MHLSRHEIVDASFCLERSARAPLARGARQV
jgi:hypothetical protein